MLTFACLFLMFLYFLMQAESVLGSCIRCVKHRFREADLERQCYIFILPPLKITCQALFVFV